MAIAGNAGKNDIQLDNEAESQDDRWIRLANQNRNQAQVVGQSVVPIQAQQNDMMNMLQQRAMGQGTSPAQLALQAQQDRNMQAASAMQQGAKNPLLAQHVAGQMLNQNNNQALQQAQAMRGTEVNSANAQLIQAAQTQQSMQQNYAVNLQKLSQQYELMGWDQEKAFMMAQQQMASAKAAAERADSARDSSLTGALLGGAGAIIGGIYGGPGGAMAGNAVGSTIGQRVGGQ